MLPSCDSRCGQLDAKQAWLVDFDGQIGAIGQADEEEALQRNPYFGDVLEVQRADLVADVDQPLRGQVQGPALQFG
jgi:hypothetical protein